MKKSYMEKLPPDVAFDIFCRLPPESVVQCKLVCKSWLSLPFLRGDDHNYFANMNLRRHLQCSLEYPTLNFIAFNEFRDDVQEVGISDVGEFHITEYDAEKLSYNVKRITFFQKCISGWNIRTRLAGSCNGLLCLPRVYESNRPTCFDKSERRKKERIGIYNLLLNEYVLLPLSDLQFKYCSMLVDMVIGFGHNPITDEYKVVRVYYDPPHSCYIGDVEVYTLGKSNGMWRSIGTIKYRLQGYSQPVLFNGSLHWLTREQLNEKTEVVGQIVSFNFEVEEFHVIPLPYSSPRRGGLKVLGGCLCLITKEEYGMDIWMLKDYTNKKSWVKKFSIDLDKEYIINNEGKPWFYSPCAIKKKKVGGGVEILLWCNNKRLFTYNPKTIDIKRVEVEERQLFDTELLFGHDPVGQTDIVARLKGAGFQDDPVLHINSLVSLKAAGEDASYAESNRKNKRAKKRKRVMVEWLSG